MCSHKVHSNMRVSLLCLKDNSFWVMADPDDVNIRNESVSLFLTWHFIAKSKCHLRHCQIGWQVQ